MGGRYLMVNDGKTHDQCAQLVGWRYHKGIALSPEFKGYISSNKQWAARSNNNQVQQWQRANDGQVQQRQKSNNDEVQQWQSPTTAVESGVHWCQSQWTKGGVVNTKVHRWETPSLPRRQRKDRWWGRGGCWRQWREEGNKGNEGKGNKGKCHLMTCWKKKKCALT